MLKNEGFSKGARPPHRRSRRALPVLLLAVSCLGVAGPLRASPPNILLIIADDQGYGDFGFMGNPLVRTPHIDDLANRSARFVNGYAMELEQPEEEVLYRWVRWGNHKLILPEGSDEETMLFDTSVPTLVE